MMCENNVRFNMLADFYEFTMSNGYFEKGKRDEIVYFDMFFRKIPDGGGFAIAAGLEQVVDYMENLKFDSDEIEFLRSKGIFSEEFLKYLETFEFSCDVYAVPEGTPIFPGEPILIVRGPAIQAQLLETMVLLTINHQSRRGAPSVNSAQDAHRATAERCSVPARLILQAVSAPQTHCAICFTVSRRAVQWLTAGCRTLTASMRRLRHMPRFIPTTACCCSIHITCLNQAS